MAVDGDGNLFIADAANHRIRKVAPNGTITTVAGDGTPGYTGDGGPATSAKLTAPWSVAVDRAGNLYIADFSLVRKVAPDGTITTVAGNGNTGYSGDGGPATNAQFGFLKGVAIDGSGSLFIADERNYRIRKVAPDGTITTVAGNGMSGYSGDGGLATSAQLTDPSAVVVDSAGNLFISDRVGGRIRKVSSAGVITTVAGNAGGGFSGDGGVATSASLAVPEGVALDGKGNLYIADSNNLRIRRVSSGGIITTVAGNGSGNSSSTTTGDGGPATGTELSRPADVAYDSFGNLYIADSANSRVRKVSPAGIITTVAGNGTAGYSGDGAAAASAQLNTPFGIAVDSAGNLYIADIGNERVRKVSPGGIITTVAGNGMSGFSGDGGAALSAQLYGPSGITVDSAGNLYIADAANQRVRKVSPGGIITTVAGNGMSGFSGDGGAAISAQLNEPSGVALDAMGNLFIVDVINQRVRRVSPEGTITTVAGGGTTLPFNTPVSATAAQLGNVARIAADRMGNLYVSESGLEWVLKVSAGGLLNRIAGTGFPGYSGDGGPATEAQFSGPMGLALDSAGDISVADFQNDVIRLLQPQLSASPVTIATPSPLAPGLFGFWYWQTLNATGGIPPYEWALVSGALPDGLALSSTGTISGTATASGTSTFTLQVTDAALGVATQAFSLSIGTLTVTTPANLPSGFVGGSYSETLTVSGGVAPYTWALAPGSGSLPAGLTLSSAGSITGTPTSAGTSVFTLQAQDRTGATGNQNFTLTIVSAGTLARSGVLPQIASGGGWKTTVTLVNTGASPAVVRLQLHADDGSALVLPLTVTQHGASQTITSASIGQVLNPESTLVIETPSDAAISVQGWIDVISSGPVSGFAIFRYTDSNGNASEGTVLLQTQSPATLDLPYDDTAGYVVGAALTNLSSGAATVTASVFDAEGSLLTVQSLSLPGNGHAAFVIPDRFPVAAGKRGLIQFQSAGGLAGLGIRASPTFALSSVPVIVP